MSQKILIEPEKGSKYFYYYPQLVVVIGVTVDKKTNFMPCVWNTALSYDPFLYGVSVGETRTTHKMLEDAVNFSINFLSFDYVPLVRSLGRSRGSEINKSEEFSFPYSRGNYLNVPVMDDAYFTLECAKTDKKTFGDHTLFVGEVILMQVDPEISQETILDTKAVSPLLYLGVDQFLTSDPESRLSLKNLPFHYKNHV